MGEGAVEGRPDGRHGEDTHRRATEDGAAGQRAAGELVVSPGDTAVSRLVHLDVLKTP